MDMAGAGGQWLLFVLVLGDMLPGGRKDGLGLRDPGAVTLRRKVPRSSLG